MSSQTSIQEIKKIIAAASAQEFVELEKEWGNDDRKGVRAAIETKRRYLKREAEEAARIRKLYEFDHSFGGLVVGLDEVGRGAVAGPLSVGAVVLPFDFCIPLLNDSKQLTPQQREVTAQIIKDQAIATAVFSVPSADIDKDGMSLSLRRAFSGALAQIEATGVHPDVVLVDGNPLHIDVRETNVVKGDAKSANIAAASIVAKVTRDAYMCMLDALYPAYGFAAHKGYASAEHIEAIRFYGVSDVHRKSFCTSFNQPSLF